MKFLSYEHLYYNTFQIAIPASLNNYFAWQKTFYKYTAIRFEKIHTPNHKIKLFKIVEL